MATKDLAYINDSLSEKSDINCTDFKLVEGIEHFMDEVNAFEARSEETESYHDEDDLDLPSCESLSVSEGIELAINDDESYTIEANECLDNDVKTLASIQGMLITSLNVRGLLNKYDQVVKVLYDSNADIMGICESFLDENVEVNEYMIPGYNVVSKHRNRHGGGVLLYVKETVKFELVEANVSTNIESLWIKVKCYTEHVTIGVIYRPPSANANYYSDLLDQLDHMHAHHDKVIAMGDLNFNYLDASSKTYIQTIESMYDMKQIITEPTRVTLTTSTLIDVILTNVPEAHIISGVSKISLSDHFMVYTSLQYSKGTNEHNSVRFRNYKSFSSVAFLNELSSHEEIADISWSNNEFQCKWESFKKCFNVVSNKHAPVTVRRLKYRCNPWVTNEIIEMMYKRDYLKKLAAKHNDIQMWDEYRKLRNVITDKLRQPKKSYALDQINASKGNSKKTWNVLKKLTSLCNKTNNITSNVTAEIFNDFFSTVGESTVSMLTDQSNNDLHWNISQCIHEFELVNTNVTDVKKLLLGLGNESSNDVLGFDSKLLRIASGIIAPILCKFINVSIECKFVLSDWKLSRVTPIYKGKGSKDDPSNYRPISVICHVAKIVEKIIQTQVMDYLDHHKLITLDQSAYLKMHNTQTSLHRVVDDWLWNMNDGLFTSVCSLDIKKCFDTINHKILLKKLIKYGFTDDVLQWFTSYLSDRAMKVFYNNDLSDTQYVNIGVPQGSVIGPTLFLIYINDINNYLGQAVCNLYADDVLIYCYGESLYDVQMEMQSSLNKIKEWYDKNLLVVNASKSNTMLVSTAQRGLLLDDDDLFELYLGDEKLQDVDCCDYLGIKINKHLQWNTHIDTLSKQLATKIWIISRLRSFLPFNSLIQIYKSFIQPKIDYAITVWGYTTDMNLNRIQRLQNRVARAIYNNYDFLNVRGIDLIASMNVMNVRQRRDYFMSLLVFKCIHGLAPDYLSNEILMSFDVSNRSTRSTDVNNVYVPNVHLSITKKSFCYQGPTVWNALPADIKQCNTIETFKIKAKSFFVQSQRF